jgi:hypothetical protein
LFPVNDSVKKLQLKSARSFPSGIVILTYST